MNGSASLATVILDWDLIGWPVWVALTIGALGALATAGNKYPPQPVRLRLRIYLPLIALSLCLLTRAKSWLGFYYRGYYAELDVAFIISFAFGVAFTVDALRARHWFSQVCGSCYAAAYTWLFLEAVRYSEKMHHAWR